MIIQQTQTTTILRDIAFPFFFDEIERPNISRPSWQNMEARSEFDLTTGTAPKNISSPFLEHGKLEIPESSARETSASVGLSFEKGIESGITQELVDLQVPRFNFLSYTEEDLLDWDAAIITPPPRPSGTIRVKLKHKGRSQPFPPENFWEE